MKKIIELRANGLGLLVNNEPFYIPDELIIEFRTKSYDLSNAFISLKNGKEEGQYKLTSDFKVPDKFLIGGKLELTIRIYSGEVIVKTWAVIPIKMIETEFGIHAFDFFDLLESKYNTLYEKINELIEKHNALDEHVADMKENI